MKRIPWRAALALSLVAAAGTLAWTQPWRSAAARTPDWTLVEVDRGSVSAQVTATGTLQPEVLVEVSSQISGRVAEVLVDFDDKVTKGQVLARIDTGALEAQRAQARASLAVARANLSRATVNRDDAERTYQRQQGLAAQGLISAADLEAAETKRASTRAEVWANEAQIQQARASLQQAEANLDYATIRSPLDGVVVSRAVDVGQTVAASLSAPTLFTIAGDLSRMQISTDVAEADVGRIERGMKVRFSVDAFPGKELGGVVRQVRNEATTVSNVVTYDAVIDVDPVDVKLRPGMTANVTFVIAEIADAVRIPNAALRFRPTMDQLAAMMPGGPPRGGGPPGGMPGGGPPGGGGGGPPAMKGTVVWKVVDGVAQPAIVKVGLSDGSRTELVEGEIAPGDQLVTELRGAKKSTIKPPGAF